MAERAPSQTQAVATAWLSPIDRITLVYCAWIVLYTLIGTLLGRAVDPDVHLARFVSIIAAILLAAWLEHSYRGRREAWWFRALQFMRGIYPVLLYSYFYLSLYSVTLIVFTDWLDPWFYGIDHWLFGYYPSLVWAHKWGHWLVQEFFHLAYFCYYPMIAGLPLYLYFKNRKAFQALIFDLTFVFYACYFFYSLVPVIGGRYFPEAFQLAHAYRLGPFTRLMAFIYNNTHHWGGAFPSSHIAVAIVLTISAFRYLGKWGYLFAVVTLFLSVSTVYCHYHWFIDAVAGVVTGFAGYYAAESVRRKMLHEVR